MEELLRSYIEEGDFTIMGVHMGGYYCNVYVEGVFVTIFTDGNFGFGSGMYDFNDPTGIVQKKIKEFMHGN